jgi:cell division protein FtsN
MTDSIDKKSKEKRDNPVVDLDAMLDEAESSLVPMNEFKDDEDAIDRLLRNADFDADDAPEQLSVAELDDFSGFSDFNKPEKAPAIKVEESEQAVENSSSVAADEFDDFFNFSDDIDESDMIQDEKVAGSVPAVADSSAAEASAMEEDAGALEELDDFSDFSDFNEPEIVSAVKTDEFEQAVKDSSPDVDGVGSVDEVDDFSSLSDDFDEADMLQDDEVAAPTPAVADLTAVDESDGGADIGEDLADEVDDFSSLSDDFDESDSLQDDEITADLNAPNKERQAIGEDLFDDLQGDENSPNKLLGEAGFDAEGVLEQTAGKIDELGDDADLNDFFQLDEVSDNFSKPTEEFQLDEAEESPAQEDDFLLPDFDITADMDVSDLSSDIGMNEDELTDVFGSEVATLSSEDNETVAELNPKQAADTPIEDVGNVKLSPFGFEQEDIKKQLEEAEKKVKKAKLFSYAALGFGAVALSAAAGLSVMMYSAKTEVSKLTEAVATLEASLAKRAVNNPNVEIDAMRNSVVQLNQQVDGFITELKGNPQFPVDLLNNKVPDIVAKQDMVSKALDMLQVKIGGLDEKVALAAVEPAVAKPPKVEAAYEHTPVKTGVEQEHSASKEVVAHEPALAPAPAKEGTAHEQILSKQEAVHEHTPTKDRAIQETTPAKVDTVPETVPAKVKIQSEAIKVKPITAEKAVLKQEPIKENRQEIPGKWGVNLVAFKQEWFAKSKAAEFARQGVFAEVIPVHETNATMYRLRVGGFKSKQEAYANTDRIKKALNLDSVWVSDN